MGRPGERPRREPGNLTSRILVLGVFAAVGGIAGSVRAVARGDGVLTVLALLGIGVLGVALAVAYVVDYARR
ncbi:hypothetical protein ACSNOK_09220 [Streptomyces sp. URMC 126]|uniref:hypothetical protein n=1 Tax=Streptomyces sp. URMC 126 TaxID=3423401 RepID=UPI003F1BF1C8